MTRALDEAMHQLQRLDIEDKLMWRTKRQFQHDIQSMFSLVDNIIAERKSSGNQEKMIYFPVCYMCRIRKRVKLDDENIRFQIITF